MGSVMARKTTGIVLAAVLMALLFGLSHVQAPFAYADEGNVNSAQTAVATEGTASASMTVAYEVVDSPQVVTVPKAPVKPSPAAAIKGNLPQTGDLFPFAWLFILVGSMLAVLGAGALARANSRGA